ncbi:amino acid adenylation domain-containing protein [Chloroflexia bacterium SDU3-3]|nr:amino acid adenylation domain-containing protein [Chloroflexia bacterium SDU3-3]
MRELWDTDLPLLAAQSGVWFAQQLDPANPIYNTGEYLELRGPVDHALLARAIRQAVGEAEALHVRLAERGGELRQSPAAGETWPLHMLDLSDAPDPRAAAEDWMRADLASPTDLRRGPLFAQAIIRLGRDHLLWYQRIHHAVIDGYGLALIERRAAEVYAALAAGTPAEAGAFAPLRPLIEEEAAYRASPDFASDAAYWREQLADAPEAATLAGRAAETSHSFTRRSTALPRPTALALRAAAERCKASWPELVLAAAAIYLHRMTGAQDVVLGLPSMNRLGSAALRVPAMVVNVLPLRLAVQPAMPVADLVRQVVRQVRAARRHQRYRYEDILRDTRRVGGRLIGPMVNILPFQERLSFGEVIAEAHNLSAGPVDDLSIAVYDRGDGLRIDLDANPALYCPEELETHLRRFVALLGHMAAGDAATVGGLPMLLPEERAALEAQWARAEHPIPALAIPALFEAQADRSPDALALVAGPERLSFAQLDERANRLAHELIARGAGRGQVVAVALPRNAWAIVALLAALKAGAAYLPLNPDYPAERLAFMLNDAKPALLLTAAQLAPALPGGAATLALDTAELSAALRAHPSIRPPAPRPDDAAYIIYTSGSTGAPKGVVVEHRSLVNLFCCHQHERFAPAMASGRLRVAHTAALSFDAAWDPILWMFAGNELHLLDEQTYLDPAALAAYVAAMKIDYLDFTPSHFQQLLAYGMFGQGRHRPKLVVLGGEALPAPLWDALQQIGGLTSYNYYGPTEATVDAYIWRADADGAQLGEPVWNTRAYVLDAAGQLAPPGVAGELHLAGLGLARGYLNRPELTAERFVADPFGPAGSRMYRTGDLVRADGRGTLTFLGRTDDQVKIRGHRIELGEVEAALARLPGVAQAAALVREDAPGERRLVAYVAGQGHMPDPAALRAALAAALPAPMVPAAIVALGALPLTPNGKLDRKALPAPEAPAAPAGRAPRTPQEAALCGLFAEVLGLPAVGIDEGFFDLGGHSLLAVRLITRVREALGVDVAIGALFERPTVAGLAARLGAAAAQRPALVPAPRGADAPLSFAQRRLWFLGQLEGPSPTYNLPLVLRLSGPLDRAALEQALADLLARHESLRTVFPAEQGAPRQRILPERTRLPLHLVECQSAALDAALLEAARHGFDLASELPLRATLFALGPGEHALLLLLHHIAGDGASLDPLARDLAQAYAARRAGGAPAWQPLPVQYADYAAWQARLLGDDADPESLIARQLAFWRGALAGAPDQLELPTDRPRPAVASYRGATVPLAIPPALHARLAALARERGATVFMVIQAALAALLTRLGAGSDIPIGSPVAGRDERALDGLIGFFVNTLVLRTRTEGNPSFAALVDRVREADLAAYAHQDVPFERLVEALNPPRSLARHPLFQVMLAFQSAPDAPLAMADLRASMRPLHIGAAKFDLLLNLDERRSADGSPAGIEGFLEYSADLFGLPSAQALAARLLRLIEAAAASPSTPIGLLPLLSAQELAQIEAWNRTAHPVAPETLPSAFLAQVARSPDAPAVVFEGAQLTYAELDAAACRLARLLIDHGAGPERIVAVVVPRSLELITALYAIHKAGAAYLPIDPDYPLDRIAFMLEDAAPACVLSLAPVVGVLPQDLVAPVLVLDTPSLAEELRRYPAHALAPAELAEPLRPDHPAYVIYTSGSTGRPKGVVVPHAGIINRLRWMQAEYRLGADDRVLQKTPSSFDVSVWEFFWPLLEGATLVVARPDGHKDPAYLAELIQAERITTIHFVPSMLQVFIHEPSAARCTGLRRVICSGEALPAELVGQFYARLDVPLHNLYGPTEASVDVTYWPCRPGDAATSVPIGRPVWNTQLRILDANMQPLPVGVAGELYLAGVQLARGYLNRPELTAERFVADPFGPAGARMYRTGDLARWRDDGAVEYIGRIDHQVKIRGFRIELEEIEAQLAQRPEVAQVAVVVREDAPGDRRIVAYVVPTALAEYDPVRLRRHLAGRLPEYMVPSAFVAVAALPLSPNGKLDRKALPAPDAPASVGGRPPRTPQEAALCEIFAEVLGLSEVGAEDSFFDLGGHSLLAVQLISRAREALGAALSIGSLFAAPTPAALAASLDAGAAADALGVLLPLRAKGDQPPLFCLHPAGGLSWCYSGLARSLGAGRPVYGIQARGAACDEPLPASMDEMAADYIAQLRAVQPSGPYHLLGWSTGGIIAHAMARQLQRQGEELALLAIIDAYPADLMAGLPVSDEIEAMEALLIMAGYDLDALGDLPMEFGSVIGVLRQDGSPLASLDEATIMRLKQIYLNTNWAMRAYRHQRVAGDLLFFRATVETADDALTAETWRPYVAGEIESHDIACSHKDITQPGPLAEIGRILAARLAAALETR